MRYLGLGLGLWLWLGLGLGLWLWLGYRIKAKMSKWCSSLIMTKSNSRVYTPRRIRRLRPSFSFISKMASVNCLAWFILGLGLGLGLGYRIKAKMSKWWSFLIMTESNSRVYTPQRSRRMRPSSSFISKMASVNCLPWFILMTGWPISCWHAPSWNITYRSPSI
jgi:hypothetical protein